MKHQVEIFSECNIVCFISIKSILDDTHWKMFSLVLHSVVIAFQCFITINFSRMLYFKMTTIKMTSQHTNIGLTYKNHTFRCVDYTILVLLIFQMFRFKKCFVYISFMHIAQICFAFPLIHSFKDKEPSNHIC